MKKLTVYLSLLLLISCSKDDEDYSFEYENMSISETMLEFKHDYELIKDSLETNRPITVGDYKEGGIVFYLLQPNDIGYQSDIQHGLVVNLVNLSPTYWEAYSDYYVSTKDVNTSQNFLSGYSNTISIYETLMSDYYTLSSFAANKCLSYVRNGYDDWFLPSIEEMVVLDSANINEQILRYNGNTLFDNKEYWTSSQYNRALAYIYEFNNSQLFALSKDRYFIVRPIRAF